MPTIQEAVQSIKNSSPAVYKITRLFPKVSFADKPALIVSLIVGFLQHEMKKEGWDNCLQKLFLTVDETLRNKFVDVKCSVCGGSVPVFESDKDLVHVCIDCLEGDKDEKI